MPDNAPALHKAELYLCLARAFAVPQGPGLFDALRDDLAGDLADLGSRLGYPIGSALAEYRHAIAGVRDAQQLLVLYSRLFLVPGEPHPTLNTGAYLDGTIAGGSVVALENCYARCGLGKRGDFHDLPDHLSAQLELVAWLLAAEIEAESQGDALPPIRAQEILAQFVARWIGPLRADIEAASLRFGLGANPYLALARLLEAVVLAEVGETRGEARPSPGIDPEIARLRSQYAGREINAKDLAIIRARLAADGLPSGHVTIPVDARDRTMGLAAMTPPAPPSHRHDSGA